MSRTQIGYSSLRQPFIYYCFECISSESLREILRKVWKKRNKFPVCAKCGRSLIVVAFNQGGYPVGVQVVPKVCAVMAHESNFRGVKPLQGATGIAYFDLQEGYDD